MRGILGFVALASATAAPAQAAPGDFTCRNAAAEITCKADGCEINRDGFTPMGVSRMGNTLEVCAYESCMTGTLDLIRVRGDQTILHAMLARAKGGVTVAYNSRTRIATMLWDNFALPMSCGG